MKKVVTSEELKEKMESAIDLLCNCVKGTLGPKGRNVIIDHSDFTPFITNDGVTIAENIESEDPVIETILELAKEASLKTNEFVGDGTTTTLVLLQSLFHEGEKAIQNGMNPMILKKELEHSLEKLLLTLDTFSHIPSKEEMISLAQVSANDEEIGTIVSNAFLKVKDKNAIEIVEGASEKTEVIYKQGYRIETLVASPYFLSTVSVQCFKNSSFLIYHGILSDIECIADILNEVYQNNRPLVILAEEYEEEFVNEIVHLFLEEKVSIILLKLPEFGIRRITILNDLALLSGATIVQNKDVCSIEKLGRFSEIKITKEETVFQFLASKELKKKISALKTSFSQNDLDKEFDAKRRAMFTKGVIQISVGAYTKVEQREKKMRFEDAVCAIDKAISGVCVGGGLTFYQMALSMGEETIGDQIWKTVLQTPLKQILINAGVEENTIISELKKSNYQKVYNVLNEEFEDIRDTKLLDSKAVLFYSLVHANSVASMLLTTTCIVINEFSNSFKERGPIEEL